jgi:hypothetical protein
VVFGEVEGRLHTDITMEVLCSQTTSNRGQEDNFQPPQQHLILHNQPKFVPKDYALCIMPFLHKIPAYQVGGHPNVMHYAL